MLSRESWLVIAGVLLIWTVWHSLGIVEVIYAERYIDEILYQSKVVCGDAFGVLLLDDYDGVFGPGTAVDCRKAARTRAVEIMSLGFLAILAVVAAFKWSSSPPAPIDTELRRLPKGERAVYGRRKHQDGPS